ncbi:MAG: hypothetical protein KDC67_03380 [Ignavibacteriae bacterium]|nr:hypothetical protein [Ignavibacteriota bacterium]
MKSEIIKRHKKEIFNATLKAANSLGLDIANSSVKTGEIKLYFNGNIFSFGNKINVSIKGEEISEVIVSSVSSSGMQLFDWGTNKKLENELLEEIQNILTK